MKLTGRLLPLTFLVLVVALPAHAQMARVEGIVRGFDGEPLQGAVLAFTQQGVDLELTAETDANGSYEMNVRTGTYRITLRVDGRALTILDGIEVTPRNAYQADFDLANSDAAREVLDAAASAEAINAALDLGRNALDAGNYDEAIEHLTLAAQSDDSQYVVLGNLAEALVGAERYDEAAENYQRAILAMALTTEPTEAASYHNNLAVSLANAGRIDEAIEALETSAQLDPAGAGSAYSNLGAVLFNRRRSAEASEAYNRSIEFDPTNAETYYQLGISYFGSNETIPDSIPVLEKYLELAPDGPNADAARQLIAAAEASR